MVPVDTVRFNPGFWRTSRLMQRGKALSGESATGMEENLMNCYNKSAKLMIR